MKRFIALASLTLALTNCGRNIKGTSETNSYEVSEDLAATGTVALSYKKVNESRSWQPSQAQTDRCNEIARDYVANGGAALIMDTMKMEVSGPTKNCLRRNEFNGCEHYEYVYTYACRYTASK